MAYTPTSKDAVAKIIKQQIGFWALAEVGARGFMFDASSLYFDAKPLSRIVRVVVTLDPSDTYTVRVVNKKTGEELYSTSMVFADMLADEIHDLPKVLQGGKH